LSPIKNGGITLRSEATTLKEWVADLTLENRLLKKSMTGAGEFEE
jgi:transposase